MAEIHIVKTKSNAPWILGLIGFIVAIPHIACAALCAAGATLGAAAAEVEDPSMMSGATEATANAATAMIWGSFGIFIVMFVLGFFGKSGASKVTGILNILGSIAALIMSCVFVSPCGIIASILFFCSGISAVCNAKRP